VAVSGFNAMVPMDFLMGLIFPLSIALALVAIVVLPYSFLWDWRKWKKTGL
jgi:hypothetical protein